MAKLEKLKSGAKKHLKDKLRVDLVEPEMIKGLAEVMTYGAKKYGDRNWVKGIPYSMSYAAAMRHLLAWASGEDKDPESTISHLKHAAANVLMAVTQDERGRKDLDDRETTKKKP